MKPHQLSDQPHDWIAEEARRVRNRSLDRNCLIVAGVLTTGVLIGMHAILKYVVG